MNLLDFTVDENLCISCQECINDCPYMILAMEGDHPIVVPERADLCIRCQHCLTVCPVGAISIHGVTPQDCLETAGNFPGTDRMETLIRGRRSIRRYQDENLDPALMHKLLNIAWQAPTGVNARQVLFTVVDKKETMAKLRDEVMDRLAEIVKEGKLPEERKIFAAFLKQWQKHGVDIIFRKAPHLLITSAPESCPCPKEDCMIALSYFELLAQSMGVGTLWDGLAKWNFTELMPEFKDRLGIPTDHMIGYVMLFGKPAVEYHRTVSHGPAAVNRVLL